MVSLFPFFNFIQTYNTSTLLNKLEILYEIYNFLYVSTFTLIVYFWLLLDNVTTGASSGIGAETTRVLAMRGVHVIMGVRNVVAAKVVMEAILKEIPNAKVDAMELDLSSMISVRKFALEFISSGLPLNILM